MNVTVESIKALGIEGLFAIDVGLKSLERKFDETEWDTSPWRFLLFIFGI